MSPPDPLPPNQLPTRLLPRIGERDPEPFDPDAWRLTVDGVVETPLELTWSDLAALPHEDRTGTVHCVTRWSRPGTTFRGVALDTILRRADPAPRAQFVRFASGRGHDTTLPLAASGEVLVADGLGLEDDVGRLPPEHGGPVRSVCLTRYFYKSVKWLRRIELLAEDRLGTWERTAGYHNNADPWREERYVVRGVDRAELRRLMATANLSGQDLLGADLSGADLGGFDLRGANLRNAQLRDANLSGADLRGASVCNADLLGADLSRSRLDDLDLDGADLRGTDLRGASGCPATLAATQFGDGGAEPARTGALDWTSVDAEGLLARQRLVLEQQGVLLPPG